MNFDKIFMERCLFLAEKGKKYVSPNPMVGAVVVYNNKIIGEGYHKEYGFPHAEVEAINNVEDKDLLEKSTLYVSLEPCCHYGKTPPCTSLIIASKIPEVVVACTDPNIIMSGKGVNELLSAGIKVRQGVCKSEAESLNKRFFTFHLKKRPYIILKWAETKDGFIDTLNRKPNSRINWISNPCSKQIVHKWRAEERGILVGSKTAINDNPALTVREWTGRNPIRVLLDPELSVSESYNIFNNDSTTLCFHRKGISPNIPKKENIEFIPIDFGKDCLTQITESLYQHKILSLIVEGGKETHEFFIENNLWDEARIIVGNKYFKSGLRAPRLNLNAENFLEVEDDIIKFYYNNVN